MNVIVIKGKSGVTNAQPKDYQKLVDQVDSQEQFSDWLHDLDMKQKVKGGYMDFELNNGEIWTRTVYSSDEVLTDDELCRLEKYTQGQWSDGIGEGFEQFPCHEIDGEEIYLSPWFWGQEIKSSQKEQ